MTTVDPALDAAIRGNLGELATTMGIVLGDLTPVLVSADMPVAGNRQPYGLLHGGASIALAETLGSIGSALHGLPDKLSVGVDINATHHRSARAGIVTGVATAIHLGRSMAAYEVVIRDEDDRRLCTSRITCALLDAAKLS